MTSRGVLFSLAVFGFSSLGVAPVAAQTVFDRFEFSFSNPGARSLGFGGAFAALADDATAAYANPAGLVQLTKPEISLEARLRRRGSEVSTTAEREESSSAGGSFVAIVLPREDWSFALYGHQLARFDQTSEFRVLFPSIFGFPSLSARIRERLDLDVLQAGAAASRRFGDHFSLGLAVSYTQVSMHSTSEFFANTEREQDRLGSATVEIDRGLWTFQAGALHRLSDRWSLGYFLRQGTEAEGPARFEPAPNPPFRITLPNEARVRVPFVGGVGVAYRSKGGAVTLAAEVDRVDYDVPLAFFTVDLGFEEGLKDYFEYHVGGEYAFLRSDPLLALRAGYWLKSDSFFSEQSDERYSVGLGFVFRPVQVDFAIEFGDDTEILSISAIYTF